MSSKEGQDILARHLINEPGFFLDIGSADPIEGNNSIELERAGWIGLLFDQSQQDVDHANRVRTNLATQCDASSFDFRTFLDKQGAPQLIDYISMDVDAANTPLVKHFPFDRYEFKILTFEHDRYNSGDERKKACEDALKGYSYYVRILDNGLVQGLQWEDWWINTKYIDSPVRAKDLDWREFLVKLGALS